MKSISYKFRAIKILIITIILLYAIFLFKDFFDREYFLYVDIIKYICIILCFIIVLFIGEDAINKKDRKLLQVGFIFTVIADTCLVIFHYFTLGVVFFCIVQIIYYFRYRYLSGYDYNIEGENNINYEYKRKRKCKHKWSYLVETKNYIILFSIIIIIYIAIRYIITNFVIMKIDDILPIAIFYAICLIFSVLSAIKLLKNKSYPYINKYMIIIGMILFFLCDVNVGLYNLTKVIDFSRDTTNCINQISYPLIWLFYLPSQVLLSLSGYKFEC